MKVHGLLLLDKPVGLSSNVALQKARRLLGADKAGHGGTLDPMASGVLPLMFGEACKLAGAALTHDKAYEAEVRFGIRTTTDDVEGEVLAQSDLRPTRAQLLAALPTFTGLISQVPPVYSALKVGGKAMYRHAREGSPIQAAARQVRVDAIEVLDFDGERARLAIACGSGTYIRSIARDLGEVLGCGAHLSGLRRTRVGQYRVQDAVTLDTLLAGDAAAAAQHLQGLLALVAGWPQVVLDDGQARRFAQGQAVRLTGQQAAALSSARAGMNPVASPASGEACGPASLTSGEVRMPALPASGDTGTAPADSFAAYEGGKVPAAAAGIPAGDQIAVLHAGRLAGLARHTTQPGGRVTQMDGQPTQPTQPGSQAAQAAQAAQPQGPVMLAPVRVILE